MKTLGVLGGMGPDASIAFYRLLIQQSRTHHHALANSDYPHILLSNIPVPDLIEDTSGEEITIRMIVHEAQKLEQAGADFLVIACNTMHLYLEHFQRAVNIPFLSVVEATAKKVQSDGRKRVSVLGSPTTLNSGLYHQPLSSKGIEVLTPELHEIKKLSSVILKVIAGTYDNSGIESVLALIRSMQKRGAEAIVLGCTELPLVINPANSSLPVYDTLSILAEAACEKIWETD